MGRKKRTPDQNGTKHKEIPTCKGVYLKKSFRVLSENQEQYVISMVENEITICTGFAGTGKTACAIGLAASWLADNKIERIILTRPVIETGISIGALPGDISEKMHPYMYPLFEELKKYFGPDGVDTLIRNNIIVISPLNYMRGCNFHNSFVVGDEMQNSTHEQVKMLLTRIGKNSRMVISGDLYQSDLDKYHNGLQLCCERLKELSGVGIVGLEEEDIIRNPIISRVMKRLAR